jgi:hypothetical protein
VSHGSDWSLTTSIFIVKRVGVHIYLQVSHIVHIYYKSVIMYIFTYKSAIYVHIYYKSAIMYIFITSRPLCTYLLTSQPLCTYLLQVSNYIHIYYKSVIMYIFTYKSAIMYIFITSQSLYMYLLKVSHYVHIYFQVSHYVQVLVKAKFQDKYDACNIN